MLLYLIAIVLEIDKLTPMVFGVRNTCCEYCNARIGAYTVKSLFIQCDNTLQCMVLEDIRLYVPFALRLSGYG